MTKYDLPNRENESVQLIERGDGRYYSVAEVDRKIKWLDKELRRYERAMHAISHNEIARRIAHQLGVPDDILKSS